MQFDYKSNVVKAKIPNLNVTSLQATPSIKGCFLKAYDNNVYYKLSNFDSYFKTFGNESLYEVIASRAGNLMGFPVLDYWLCKGKVSIDNEFISTAFCASLDFNTEKKKKISIETLYKLKKYDKEDILSFCKRMNISKYIYSIMIFDYVICNRDRHGANIEFLIDSKEIIPTPIFDNGVCLMFSCLNEEAIERFDVTSNPRVNNYIGSQDLEFNLSLIDEKIDFNLFSYSDRDFIFKNMEDLLSNKHKSKIMDMLVWRCEYAKEILDT